MQTTLLSQPIVVGPGDSLQKQSEFRKQLSTLIQIGDATRFDTLLSCYPKASDKQGVLDAPDAKGLTVLMEAAVHGRQDIVTLLLEAGAGTDCRDNAGWTPLIHACAANQPTIARILLRANPSQRDARTNTGNTALLRAAKTGSFGCLKLLIENGSPIEQTTRTGKTALYYAASRNDVAMTDYLLKRGAQPDAVLHRSPHWTPLHQAAHSGHAEVTCLLLRSHGSHQKVDVHGNSPLHIACRAGHPGIAKLLLAYGADVCAVDDHGNNALHIAAASNNHITLSILLQHMARSRMASGAPAQAIIALLQRVNREGKSALDMAIKANATDAVVVLSEAIHEANRLPAFRRTISGQLLAVGGACLATASHKSKKSTEEKQDRTLMPALLLATALFVAFMALAIS